MRQYFVSFSQKNIKIFSGGYKQISQYKMNSLAFDSLLCSGVFIDQAQAQLQQQIRYDRRV